MQFFLVAANPREGNICAKRMTRLNPPLISAKNDPYFSFSHPSEAELASAIETAATVGTLVCNLDAMASASCVNLAGSEHGAMRAARLLELALLYTDAAEKP